MWPLCVAGGFCTLAVLPRTDTLTHGAMLARSPRRQGPPFIALSALSTGPWGHSHGRATAQNTMAVHANQRC